MQEVFAVLHIQRLARTLWQRDGKGKALAISLVNVDTESSVKRAVSLCGITDKMLLPRCKVLLPTAMLKVSGFSAVFVIALRFAARPRGHKDPRDRK